jgi:hypothetical protein
LAGKVEISAARRVPEVWVIAAVPATVAALVIAAVLGIVVAPVSATTVAALAHPASQAEARAAATSVAAATGSAIVMLAAPLRWVIAVVLAAARAATTEARHGQAADAGRPVWAASEAVEVAAALAVAVAVAAALVVAVAVVAVAVVVVAEGNHHEQTKSHQLNNFKFDLAETPDGRYRYGAFAFGGSGDFVSRRRTNNSGWER